MHYAGRSHENYFMEAAPWNENVTIPLQSFSNKTKCITNINNCHENRNNENKLNNKTTTITPGSSNDSILKSIDEDNKSTSSSVSTSSAFEDSTNLYSEKSESSMSSINKINGNEDGNKNINLDAKIMIIENGKHNDVDDDDALEVLSSYDNDSGNDEFDEKGDGFNNFSYSSSDSRCDKKSRNYFNSLPLMRAKKQQIHTNFNSIRRRNFINNDHGLIEQEPFHDDIKVINLPSPSPSSWSSDSNMIQQQNLSTKSSSVPMLTVRRDQCHEDFNKLTVLRNSRSQSDRYLCAPKYTTSHHHEQERFVMWL
ncbi:hypothetical protein PVAND_001378 [Polypedilum vanderplanki]|uniref:Uncharacterized protein n=1 Tax=Polypedilum vanderplanki TaxID=319348 RepID=A0A9J6BP24_POLVA|nr:hypothetical protein PVAND_001378 [Polypedilum vanderplanki]